MSERDEETAQHLRIPKEGGHEAMDQEKQLVVRDRAIEKRRNPRGSAVVLGALAGAFTTCLGGVGLLLSRPGTNPVTASISVVAVSVLLIVGVLVACRK